MNESFTFTLNLSTWTLLGALCVAAIGCGRDAGKGATIALTNGSTTLPGPSPTPYLFRGGNRIDADSQGGNEDGLLHQTSNGLTVSNPSVGGTFQKMEATSANFKVTGGIYVQ
jgi:hypothetical protein